MMINTQLRTGVLYLTPTGRMCKYVGMVLDGGNHHHSLRYVGKDSGQELKLSVENAGILVEARQHLPGDARRGADD